MEKDPLEIVIPIYNEGEKVIKLLNQFQIHIKTKFKVLLCYDLSDDNIFNYEEELKKLIHIMFYGFKAYDFVLFLISILEKKTRNNWE